MKLHIFTLCLAALLATSCKEATKPAIQLPKADTIAAKPVVIADSLMTEPIADSLLLTPVTALQTVDGIQEDSTDTAAYKYPDSVTVYNTGKYAASLAAYGVAYNTWLAPKNWTGDGAVGADGNAVANLYPTGGQDKQSSYIEYYTIPACSGCMLDAAMPYFPELTEAYNSMFNEDGKNPYKAPAGLRVNRLSKLIATYTKPNKNGMTTRGVACHSDGDDAFFCSADFTMPDADSALASFLVMHYAHKFEKTILSVAR